MKSKADLVTFAHEMIATDPAQVWAAENSAFGGIHAPHMVNSEHYLDEAVDFNYGHGADAAGENYPPEVHWVETVGLPRAVEAGFSVRWQMGPGDHRDHLHVDCNRYGYSAVYGNDMVPTDQIKALLQRIGQWKPGQWRTAEGYKSTAQNKAVQRAVGVTVDGIYGPQTTDAVESLQRRLKRVGYKIKADGEWGPATDQAYDDFCDGDLGERTIRLWQIVAGTPTDGKISEPSQLILAVQSRHKIKPTDGVLGPDTWRGIQRWLRVRADGVPGPVTVRALQRHLLRGQW